VTETSEPERDVLAYPISVVLGLLAGWLDLKVGDLLLTAVAVMIFTMFLGITWPRRPWRWLLLLAVGVPVVRGIAYFFLGERVSRAQVMESLLGFLTGMVGVYAGSSLRRAMQALTGAK
jgi:ABC-type multidrug transport system permease subunit